MLNIKMFREYDTDFNENCKYIFIVGRSR